MKRPKIVHFVAIKTQEHLAIRASVSSFNVADYENDYFKIKKQISDVYPIKSYSLLKSEKFYLTITIYNKENEKIYSDVIETDSFGHLFITLNDENILNKVHHITVHETGTVAGLEFLLGSFFPHVMDDPKKIIISDFDKTLAETTYSNFSEVIKSLTTPLRNYPVVTEGLNLLRDHISKNFHPFILSASPHFYEDAIRDWLYQKKIFTAAIFLKDYRHILSFIDGLLSPKDIIVQGKYKLHQLLEICFLVGIPDEIVLVGDNFESDPFIYGVFAYLMSDKSDPWDLWNFIRRQQEFKLTKKQSSDMLDRFYKIKKMINNKTPKISVFIRSENVDQARSIIPQKFLNEISDINVF